MAVDMFLKIEGIDGEAQDAQYGRQIDVLAWSWGASQSGTTHFGGGGGKASFQDLSVTKWTDRSTAILLARLADGRRIDEARLTVRRGGEKPVTLLVLTMKRLLVTSLSLGGSGGEDRLTENITLNFAEFSFQYVEQLWRGELGAKPEFSWNIATNHPPGWKPPPPRQNVFVPPPIIEESVIEDSADDGCPEGSEMVYFEGGGRDCMPIELPIEQ